jgi:hypothetical protein
MSTKIKDRQIGERTEYRVQKLDECGMWRKTMSHGSEESARKEVSRRATNGELFLRIVRVTTTVSLCDDDGTEKHDWKSCGEPAAAGSTRIDYRCALTGKQCYRSARWVDLRFVPYGAAVGFVVDNDGYEHRTGEYYPSDEF